MNYRHELKFLCGEKDLRHMENKIRGICRLDEHTREDGTYLIKSLYFDSPDDQCYSENLAGVDNRKKYRIRIYNNETDEIRLECKYSCRGLKAKDICRITRAQCESVMKGLPLWTSLGKGANTGNSSGSVSGGSQELLLRFLAERSTEMLSPKVIVEYVRTPYIFSAGNVRITFDRAIRSSPHTGSFLGKTAAFRSILPPDINILEVKYDQMLPVAILELLAGGQDLQRTSFSKYALCRQYGIF